MWLNFLWITHRETRLNPDPTLHSTLWKPNPYMSRVSILKSRLNSTLSELYFLIKERKNNSLFINLIVYNSFSDVSIDNYLIDISAYNLLILLDLIKLIIFNNYISVVNEILK